MTRHSRRTLMIVENQYPHDIRVRKEAEALAEAGYSVSVIALRGQDQKAYEEINQVKIYRIPEVNIFEKTKHGNSNVILKIYSKVRSIAGYVLEYAYFTISSYIISLYIFVTHGFDVVHTHNPPDTLSMIGIFYKLLGKKYVFDHHDLSPELYLTRVSGKRDLIYRGLIFFEWLSCRFSDIIISTNESYRQVEINRYSVNPEKIFIVRNNPLLIDCICTGGGNDYFKPVTQQKILLFLGSINPQDGVDVLLQVVHHLVYVLERRDCRCRIIGDGDYLDSAKRLSRELNVMEYVDFTGMITDREKLKKYLAQADIGIEPAPLNEVNQYSTFIKVMEYMAASKPVVAFDLEETRYSVAGAALLVPPQDYKEFAHAIGKLLDAPQLREQLGKAGLERIEKELNWEKAASSLKEAYAALFP
jgi:glycosyltransferase involved in cell wall biosynthesis